MDIHTLVGVIIYTSLAGGSTLIGALIIYFLTRTKKISPNVKKGVVALGGGVLLSAITLVLIPEGSKDLSVGWGSFWFMAGSLVFLIMDIIIEHSGESASQIMANIMDSFPESIGIGAALGGGVGFLLIILVGLQNITEGFNAYDELRTAGVSTRKNFILQIVSSLSAPLGGIIGFLFLIGHTAVIGAVFMFSAGGILYLIFHDIAPLAHSKGHWVPTLGASVGFAVGLVAQYLV